VDSRDMVEMSEQIYKNHCKKVAANEKRKYWALNGISRMLENLVKKRK
jgi:hypothetical protein